MDQIQTLLDGVMEARGNVLVKLNVAEPDLDAVIAILPSMKSPTVSKLFGDGGYAVETMVAKATINTLIPDLKDAGASDIIELQVGRAHVELQSLMRISYAVFCLKKKK